MKDEMLLEASLLFDEQWYAAQNKDSLGAQTDPIGHFLANGTELGLDPGPYFNTKTYLEAQPDVRKLGMNPLVHFLRYGLSEAAQKTAKDTLAHCVYRGMPLHKLKVPGDAAARLAELRDTSVESAFNAPPIGQLPKGGPLAVFVTHDANIGGAPRVLESIARWFVEHTDFRVKIVCMSGGPWVSRFQDIAETHVVGELRVPERSVEAHRSSLTAFLQEEPAFVFINSAAAGDYVRIDPYRAPVFAFLHEQEKILDIFEGPFKALMERSSHVFCDGEGVLADVRRLTDLAGDKLSLRHCFIDGVDLQNSSETIADARKQLGWPTDRPIVVGCGVAHWRKQPDLFIRAAKAALQEGKVRPFFVWIGDGPDLKACKSLAVELGIEKDVDFTGHREDFRELIGLCDVFALTSSEDPFPLVCLEAASLGLPNVIFREAGDMPALVEPTGEMPAGIAVPLNDHLQFGAALADLCNDEQSRRNMGETAARRIAARFTTQPACREILTKLQKIAGIAPRVSIIVPNYNCGPYLVERLDSVAAQGFQDVEVLLLDDCSSDGSEKILMDYAERFPQMSVHLAKSNSGGVFSAWARGLEMAKGDLVWIAEADDWCEPDFLQRAVSGFTISGMRLVHGRSIPTNSAGAVSGDWNKLYLNRIEPGRWTKSYVNPAHKEVEEVLGVANTIVNGSGAVVLRQAAQKAIAVTEDFKLAGDWAYYLAVIAGGRVAYNHHAINYHRRHDTSVTKTLEGSGSYFRETADIGALIEHLYGASESRTKRFIAFQNDEAKRFGVEATDIPVGKVPAAAFSEPAPTLLYGVGDLSNGGAQMFAARFVAGWSELPANAVLFTVGQEPDHPATRKHIPPSVPVISAEEIQSIGFSQFVSDWGIECCISGHWWADRLLANWMDQDELSMPWVIAMHGCYETLIANPRISKTRNEDFALLQKHCDCWVPTAPKNTQIFDDGLIKPKAVQSITNGFKPMMPSEATRADFNLSDSAFVFTLASRAIDSKGWKIAAEAFRALRRANPAHNLALQLIGDGTAANEVKASKDNQGISFVPHTSRLADYIAVSDVGLLPSWFEGESLPLVVIEFLAQGKPVVVSDIGRCEWMIGAETASPAGLVVARNKSSGRVSSADLQEAMQKLIDSPVLMQNSRKAAALAFEKFDFDEMLVAYRKLIDGAIAARKRG